MNAAAPPLDRIEAATLAWLLMLDQRRPLHGLYAEVRAALGWRRLKLRRGRVPLDALHHQLTGLIADEPVWRMRAETAYRRALRAQARQAAPARLAAERRAA